jgi:hypothetical protein
MLANIKFKVLEELKMTRAEEYDYDEFLSDSSDDSLPFPCDKEDEPMFKSQLKIKQADDDMIYQEAYSQDKIRTALQNVLTLAGERLEQFHTPDYTDADIEIADESIRAVRDYYFHSGESIITNSQIAKNDKDN